MFLSDFVKKEIYTGDQLRGVCLGVGLSLKTHAVKYLLCACDPASNTPEFALPITAIDCVDNKIRLRRLRPVFPKNCAKIFPRRPVYTFDGRLIGTLTDLELSHYVATRLFINERDIFPISAVTACSDAIILKKDQPFPLGQRVPAPLLSMLCGKNDAIVTKPILRSAIKKGALVKLTLSLPPFNVEFYSFPRV